MSNQYRWGHPIDWLLEAIDDWEPDEIKDTLKDIVRQLDGDFIQDMFQGEMDKDGYFKQVKS